MNLIRLIELSLNLMVPARKRQLMLLLGLMILASFAEALSIGAVIPLLNVVTQPSLTIAELPFGDMLASFGSNDRGSTVIFIVCLFVLAVLISGVIRLALLYLSTKISFLIGKDFSEKIFENTINKPYEEHLKSNSSEIISGATEKVNIYIYQFLLPMLVIISNLFIFFTIAITLLFIEPIVFFSALFFFGTIYIFLTKYTKNKLFQYSRDVSAGSVNVIRLLQQGFAGIREVLLSNSQKKYLNIYRSANSTFRLAQANSSFIGSAPRFVVEPLGMILIALVCFVMVYPENADTGVVGTLGVFVVAAQRMLPLMQQAYSSFVQIRAGERSVVDILNLMEKESSSIIDSICEHKKSPFSQMYQGIDFSNVAFRYSPNQRNVIKNLNLTIPVGCRVGIVGSTGSGKSTLLDLIVGLLTPTEGSISIDGKNLKSLDIASWRSQIGYVSQSMFLSDASIAENIAFGKIEGSYDLNKVRLAAEKAQISNFIESLPNGYFEMVGEGGVRLSGGQRQRIAVARALYRNVKLIVFDEATSALDEATESDLMKAVYALDQEYTIIIVAHRASTLKSCDVVFELANGSITVKS